MQSVSFFLDLSKKKKGKKKEGKKREKHL